MSFLSKSLTNAVTRNPWHQSREKREHMTMIFKDQKEATMTCAAHIFCDREYHD